MYKILTGPVSFTYWPTVIWPPNVINDVWPSLAFRRFGKISCDRTVLKSLGQVYCCIFVYDQKTLFPVHLGVNKCHNGRISVFFFL